MTSEVSSFDTHYRETGYIHVPSVLSPVEVSAFREKFRDIWKTYGAEYVGSPRMLQVRDLLKQKDILHLSLLPVVVDALKQVLGKDYVMLPGFQVQRNLFSRPGWHTDSNAEGAAPYLLRRDYRFLKCGIYFQDNTVEWGGGVDIVSGGHRFPIRTGWPRLDLKVKYHMNRLGEKNAYKVPIRAGDFIAFDSRLPHCSSWPNALQHPKSIRNAILNLAPECEKFVFYWDASANKDYIADYLDHIHKRMQRKYDISDPEAESADYSNLNVKSDFPSEFLGSLQQRGVALRSGHRN